MHTVITGGTKGIGCSLAHIMASEGHTLAITARTEEDLKEMQSEFASKYAGKDHLFLSADVSKKSEAKDFAREVLDKWGKIDILVNNAGLFIPGSLIEEEEGALEKMIETNLYSAYHISRTFIPTMISQQKGHIINVCSVASLQAYPNGGSYSISKFAMLGFSKGLREELKEEGIRVTSVMPGATWTASWEGSGLEPDRLMSSEDVAQIIFQTTQLGPNAVVEDLVIRPQLGDL